MMVKKIFSSQIVRNIPKPLATPLGKVNCLRISSPNYPFVLAEEDPYLSSQLLQAQKIGEVLESPYCRLKIEALKPGGALELSRVFESWQGRINPFFPGYAAGAACLLPQGESFGSGRAELLERFLKTGPRPMALFAEGLETDEALELTPEAVRILALKEGTAGPHSLVIPKGKGIACLFGLGENFGKICPGDTIAVDGLKGVIYVNPSGNILGQILKMSRDYNSFMKLILKEERELPAVTRDSQRILVSAVIDNAEGADAAGEYGLDGAGLFRTEMPLLTTGGADQTPWEETSLLKTYLKIVQAYRDISVVFRTLDIEPSKQIPAHSFPFEDAGLKHGGLGLSLGYLAGRENQAVFGPNYQIFSDPAIKKHLGFFYEIFRNQIKAAALASRAGRVKIVFPLVLNASQFQFAKTQVSKILEESGGAGGFNFEIGAMIETQEAAAKAEEISLLADFIKIGTGDLTSSALAISRNSAGEIEEKVFHPRVLGLLKSILEGSQRASTLKGKRVPVGICGDAAFHLLAVPLFAGMGVEELSGSAGLGPLVKHLLRNIFLEDVISLKLGPVFNLTNDGEVRTFLLKHYQKLFRSGRFPREDFFTELLGQAG